MAANERIALLDTSSSGSLFGVTVDMGLQLLEEEQGDLRRDASKLIAIALRARRSPPDTRSRH
jgi:hypothetical protein